jgi:hypothetical protein
MLSVNQLIESGYEKFDDQSKVEHKPYYLGTYKKRISDKSGTKYFINIEHWDLKSAKPGFDSYAQFHTNESNYNHSYMPTQNISLFMNESMSLDDVERWFETAWDIEYYKHL